MSKKNNEKYLINSKIRLALIIFISFSLLFFLPSNVIFVEAADTIIVDDDIGGGDYTSIQTAINNAGIGDNIIVKDGTYAEQLTVNVPSISIAAASGETPVIYVSSYSVGIDITVQDVLIDGFEIFGNTSNNGFYPAIRASSGSTGLWVTNCDFKVFTGQIGNLAIQIMDTVTDVTNSYNTITNYERGISLSGNSWATIQANTFNNVNVPIDHSARNPIFPYRYFGSIQYTIDQSNPEAVINVNPGIFNENVNINKPLTLSGIHAYENPITRTRTEYESIIDGGTSSAIIIASGTNDVIIRGLTITISSKSGINNEAGILIGTNTSNIIILNNIIENISDGSGIDTIQDETYGIMIYGNVIGIGQSTFDIYDNLIQNIEEYGIAINDNTSDVLISGNLIRNLTGSDHSSDPFWDPSWPSIVCSAIHLGGQVGPVKNIDIDSNILTTNIQGDGTLTAAGGGISFAGVQEWNPPNRPWEGFENISITSNIITNNTMGIIALDGIFNNGLNIHDNDISNNTYYGINNNINTIINATNNWWGNISGPFNSINNPTGTGVNVSENVTYWPWYEFNGYSIKPTVDYQVGTPNSMNGLYIKSITSIDVDALDDESGIKSLTYRTWNTTHYWTEWSNFTDEINLNGEGKHMVEYNATDVAGTKNSDIKTHYVDDIGPWIEIISPNGGEFIRGDLNIEWYAADKIPDQKQIKTNGSYSLSGDYPGHIQSFEPTNEILNSVDLTLSGDAAEVSVTIFSEISPVPVPIGTITKIIQDITSPQIITFPFESAINLDTDEEYYLGVTQQIIGGAGINWYYFNSTGGIDPYPHGQAWIKKTDEIELHPEIDWAFITNFWNENIYLDIQFSNVNPPLWTTIAEDEENDGEFLWDTSTYPDGEIYLIRIIAEDLMLNGNSDISDGTFIIDNTGPSVYNVIILDTTIGSTEYTSNGNRLEISANIYGEISNITADLTGFGKGSSVEPNSIYQDTATWVVNSIDCTPANGEVSVTITVTDPNDDIAEGSASIIADNSPPELEILRPLPGIYIMDGQRLLPYPYPVIIGQITIRADVNDVGAGIEKVEFYIDNTLRETINESDATFEYIWDEAAIGFFRIEAIAYDTIGFNSTATVNDVFIINFDIWG